MNLIMKRLFSALAFISMAAFAMPAVAAPYVVEKHQIPVPKVDPAILKSVSSLEFSYTYNDFDRNYFTKKGKNLPVSAILASEIDCQNTTYRTWIVGLDTPALSRRVGYLVNAYTASVTVLEARQAGKSKWKIFDPKSGYYSAVVYCSSGNAVLINALRTPSAGYAGIKASFDTFDKADIWKNPAYPNMPAYSPELIVDGVKQFAGHLSLYGTNSTPSTKPFPYGDSRVVVLGGPSEGLHTLPWYRDLTNVDLKPGEAINVNYYRLSDGYGVAEIYTPPYDCSVSPCKYGTPITTYYRIHDGESAYSIVPSLPTVTIINNETVGIYKNGINVYASGGYGLWLSYSIDLNIHGLSDAVLKNYSLNELNRGSVAWENAKQMVVRYFVASSLSHVQYWQAVVQK